MSSFKLKQLFSIHAEIHALARAKRSDLDGATVHVACLSKGGRVRVAKPCLTCAIALAKAGVQQAIYTIDENNYGVCDLSGEIDHKLFYKSADASGYRK